MIKDLQEVVTPADVCAPCPEFRHPPQAVKSITTDQGMVYACERCSRHWFRKYGDDEKADPTTRYFARL